LLFFAYFRFKFFASLHLSNFRFEAKRSEAKFAFFRIFRLKFFASLRFSNFCFEAKLNSCIFFRFFFTFFPFFLFFSLFFAFFHFFSLNFRFATIFLLNFRLFYLRFRFRFLVFRIEVNHVKSGFFFASKRNEIFTSISNFASEAKVRAHPNITSLGFTVANKVTILGLKIKNDLQDFEEIWDSVANKIYRQINHWSRFNLSLPGRISIAKCMMYSQLNYLGCFLLISKEKATELGNIIETFVVGNLRIAKKRLNMGGLVCLMSWIF
jgi:hypothetical protein